MRQPPKLARKFLRWFCREDCIEEIEGDLTEVFMKDSDGSPRLAKWKFVYRTLKYLRPEFLKSFAKYRPDSFGMIKSYFKIGWRNILRSKGYSFINVSGLAIGLTAAMLILLWVQNEMSYDRFHAHADRIYQVYSRDLNNGQIEVWGNTSALLAPELLQSYAEIENAVRHRNVFFLAKAGEHRFNEMGAFADPGFLNMFSFPLVKGTRNALADESGIVLTRSMAVKLFGTIDCLGRDVEVNDNDVFKVTAVMDDLPLNTNLEFSYLLPWNYMTRLGWDKNQTWAWTNAGTYVLLREGQDEASLESKVSNIVKRYIREGDGATREVFLHPLTKVHLYNKAENGNLTGGQIETVRMFTLIAGLVVLIACINFINLSTARSEKRAREVGVRKIMGAYNGSLIAQFLVESTLLVMLACSIALLLVGLSLPLFNQVMETSLHLELFQFQFWLYAVAIILLTGLLAGSYPAIILSSYQPAKALKGTFSRIKGAVDPRKLLVVVQFTAALTLSISAVVVQRQIKYAQDRKPGYDPEDIAYEFLQGKIPLHFEAIKNELIASGAVTSVTRTFSPIVRIWNNATGLTWQGSNDADKTTNFLLFGADADMSTTFATRILLGRDLDIYMHPSDTAAVLLNEAAVKAMRMDNPIGEMLRDSDGMNWQVVGVVQDFIMDSPYNKISPMIIQGWRDRYGVINYRFNKENSYADNVKKAEMVFKTNNPEYPFECISAQSNYLRKFRLEVQTGVLASWFAGLTILISCLGLFGLATYLAESRTKEVGVRKVLGATTFQITSMLALGFVKLVVISIVIGTPAAWYIADNWLQSYDYRTPLNLWIFLLMGLIAILIALITVSTQAIKAAMMNPVKSLRNE